MFEDLRGYAQLAAGVGEAAAAKTRDAVSGLVARGVWLGAKALPDADVVGQVSDLAEDVVNTSKANGEAVSSMVRAEVDRAVARLGFVREDELAALRRQVQRLEGELADVRTATAPASHEPAEADSEGVSEPDEDDAAAAADAADTPEIPKKRKKILVDPEAGA